MENNFLVKDSYRSSNYLLVISMRPSLISQALLQKMLHMFNPASAAAATQRQIMGRMLMFTEETR